MKRALLALLSAGIAFANALPPPGTLWWETSAGATDCYGHDLSSVGWAGDPGSGCLSLPSGAAEDYWLLYYVWSGCSINVYADAGCSNGSVVADVPVPPAGLGSNGCLSVASGFRALEVNCTSSASR